MNRAERNSPNIKDILDHTRKNYEAYLRLEKRRAIYQMLIEGEFDTSNPCVSHYE